ncbi:MAG: hypothetical protein GY698_06825 [Actinomycetia bacterium]|nr:hypothetical protein [Actinomycetes bacterium]
MKLGYTILFVDDVAEAVQFYEQAFGIELTLTTDDVAPAFAKAVDAGAAPLAEPHDTPWGQTVSCVRDHVGTLVSISSPVGP